MWLDPSHCYVSEYDFRSCSAKAGGQFLKPGRRGPNEAKSHEEATVATTPHMVTKLSLHTLYKLRRACDLAPSLKAGLQACSRRRRRKISYQVILLQKSLGIPGPVDMFFPEQTENLHWSDPYSVNRYMLLNCMGRSPEAQGALLIQGKERPVGYRPRGRDH